MHDSMNVKINTSVLHVQIYKYEIVAINIIIGILWLVMWILTHSW